jgi:predicted kinase
MLDWVAVTRLFTTEKGMCMSKENFDIIILNGRPAAGKSEIIDYLKHISVAERLKRFHIGEFEELDDFPILWDRYQDDNIFESLGQGRFFTDTTYEYRGKRYSGFTFKEPFFWNFLIEKLNQQYQLKLRDDKKLHDKKTIIIEFSRGAEHGGFCQAYDHLADDILQRAVTIYIKVSFEESLRKNRRRFNPDKPESILEHALEDKKLEMLYKDSDWEELSSKDPEFLHIKGQKIPYAVFENEPEKTDKPDILGAHLEEVCQRLWRIRTKA